MSDIKISKLVVTYLSRLGIPVEEAKMNQIDHLIENMLSDPLYSSVSKISDFEEIAYKHVLDSLAPLSFNLPVWKAQRIVDLGTGGGFPCLPLAIFLPAVEFVAVDARKKSVDFVARMAARTGLKNVSVQHSRIEDLGRLPQFREKSDLVVCRALSAARTLVEYMLPLVKNGGHAFMYKGPKLDEELSEAGEAFKAFSVKSEAVTLLRLVPPELPFERNFLLVHKTISVPEKFPRKSGLPTSKPL